MIPERPPKPNLRLGLESPAVKLTVMSFRSEVVDDLPMMCMEWGWKPCELAAVMALMDTGAQISVLSPVLAAKLLATRQVSKEKVANLAVSGVGSKLIKIGYLLLVTLTPKLSADQSRMFKGVPKTVTVKFAVIDSGFDMILSSPDLVNMKIHGLLPSLMERPPPGTKKSVMSCAALGKMWRVSDSLETEWEDSDSDDDDNILSTNPVTDMNLHQPVASDSASNRDTSHDSSTGVANIDTGTPSVNVLAADLIPVVLAIKGCATRGRRPGPEAGVERVVKAKTLSGSKRRKIAKDNALLAANFASLEATNEEPNEEPILPGKVVDSKNLFGGMTEEEDIFKDLDPFLGKSSGVLPVVEDGFSASAKAKLQQVFDKYKTTFGENIARDGAKIKPLVLERIPGKADPPIAAVRRMSPSQAGFAKEEVARLLKEGIIRKSLSPYRSAVCMAKKGESWRMCVDYVEMNKTLEGMSFPLPNIRDILDQMAGKRFFGKLDLRSGYHQFPMDEKSRRYTAFSTQEGHFEYNRIPFGLKMAPSYFQHSMQQVLGSLIGVNCFIYVDDIVIFGDSEDEFCSNLEKVLVRLRQYDIVLRGEKCLMSPNALEVLGYEVNGEGVTMSASKKQGLTDMVQPSNKMNLMSFNGLANYFRPFIPNFSTMMKPLTSAVNTTPYVWTDAMNTAFLEAKAAVNSMEMIHFIDEKLPVYLRTDASKNGVGGILFQRVVSSRNEITEERPIAFVSKAFNDTEKNWSTIEQEGFAIFFCIQKLENYLMGRQFNVETDHRNLVFMAKSSTPKVIRWRMRLSEYDFSVTHVPGVENVVADGLSRCLLLRAAHVMCSRMVLVDSRVVAPPTAEQVTRLSIIASVHNSVNGHFGVKKTIKLLLKDGHQWPGISDDVKAFIDSCASCQKNMSGGSEYDDSSRTTMSSVPFEKVSIDTMGPFPVDEDGNRYIIVCIDCFTRVVEIKACKDASAASAAIVILEIVGRYGPPGVIHSDNGSQYVAEVIKELLYFLNVNQSTTLPYRPQANGICERANQETLRHLRAIVGEDPKIKASWSKFLPLVARIMNYSYHSAIGTFPAQLLYGANCNGSALLNPSEGLVIDKKKLSKKNYVAELTAAQLAITAAASKHQDNLFLKREAKGKLSVSERKRSLEKGDFVIALYATKHKPDKLVPKWRGPFIITGEGSKGDSFLVQHLLQSSKIEELHISKLRFFDASRCEPEYVAMMDKGEDRVCWIVDHNPPGPFKRGQRKNLDFQVRWEGCSSDEDTWLPYMEVRDLEALDMYLSDHNLKFI
jgi:hypothetical protein